MYWYIGIGTLCIGTLCIGTLVLVVVRGLATTSDKSPAVKFYCPVPYKEYLLCIFHSCAFYRMQDIHSSCFVFDSL